MPDLKYYYSELKFGMKESLNAFLRAQNKNPEHIWSQIEDAIKTVVLSKEQSILDIVQR